MLTSDRIEELAGMIMVQSSRQRMVEILEQALREERAAIADWLESQKTEDSGGIENVANFIYQSLANELRDKAGV